ncbi:hypothetical protein BKI52_37980 [marine bacterium AO1-C]|nr:hypothetical protein BKI52_37980 [marine bacterium AO1-C]
MKKAPVYFYIILLMSLWACQSAARQNTPQNNQSPYLQSNVTVPDKASKVQAVVQKYHQKEGFTGAVLVAQNNQIVWKGGVGLARQKTQRKNTSQTKFLVGSVSKQFTSMIMLQLVQEGKIKLTDYAIQYLPFLSNEKSKITIHQLLSHTSGLAHYAGLRPRFRTFQYKNLTPMQYAKIIAKMNMHAQPNQEMHYSSMGYILLAVIAEKITGKSYGQLIKERIAQPLELKSTGFTYHTEKLRNFATSYDITPLKDGGFDYDKGRPRSQTNTYSTGGVHSTVEDLYVWLKSFQTNRLLNDKLRQKLFTPNMNRYAYGWVINDKRLEQQGIQAPTISHTGSVNDYRAMVTMFNDQKDVVIILSNCAPVKLRKMSAEIYQALKSGK